MKKTGPNKPHVVIFVEGDTDKVFFDHLIQFYRDNSTTEVVSCEVRNLRGVSRYTNKIVGKLQNDICPKALKKGMAVTAVCCSYDTDVFEYAERPVVDWNKVEREVKKLGIREFCHVRVEQMMEDWLLDDLAGICAFLKLKKAPIPLAGETGYQKMQNLFKRANKLYLKGNSITPMMTSIDMNVIRQQRQSALARLESILNVTI